jgi:hypothetical protein
MGCGQSLDYRGQLGEVGGEDGDGERYETMEQQGEHQQEREISVGRWTEQGREYCGLRQRHQHQHNNTVLSLSRSHHSTVAQRHRAPPTPPMLDRLHSQHRALSLDQSMPKDPGAR